MSLIDVTCCCIFARSDLVDDEAWQYVKEQLVDKVWDIYRSDSDDCHPKGDRALEFK